MQQIVSIVVTYNAMQWIDKCLRSLLNGNLTSSIIIVDNGSSDQTVEHIKKTYPEVKIVEARV